VQRRHSHHDVSLLANGVQRGRTPHLLGRMAVLAHVTPVLGVIEE